MLIVIRRYGKKLQPHQIPLWIKFLEVKREQFLTKSQHCLRRGKFEIVYIGSRSILTHKGSWYGSKSGFHVNHWIPWSMKSSATLVNGVKEDYWVRNEYAIFYSMFLSNLWVHENCVRGKFWKKHYGQPKIIFLMGIQVYTCIIIPISNCNQKLW